MTNFPMLPQRLAADMEAAHALARITNILLIASTRLQVNTTLQQRGFCGHHQAGWAMACLFMTQHVVGLP